MRPPSQPSPWPSLRRRARALTSEVYAEAIGEVVACAHRALPSPAPGAPTLGAWVGNVFIASVSVFVAAVGGAERLVAGVGGLPVNDIREATLEELRTGAGELTDKRLLPSAYEVWIGSRENGLLRLRYAYDVTRLRALLDMAVDSGAICRPLRLDDEVSKWVTAHVTKPAAGTQLAVWRALKRRLYHYDAGVVAFYGFPRNYMLSRPQWEELLRDRPRAANAVALDVGAGDGSLSLPMRHLFANITATELTIPLVLRLRASGLHAVVAEELQAEHLGCSQFDVIFILNVLDRCKDPFLMLEQAHSLLSPDGWLVVSVVLPASQSDAASTMGGAQRRWNVTGSDFETGAASLVRDVLMPAGFTPMRIVRVPYFCAGDRYSPVAALDASIIVLRRTPRANEDAARGAACEVCR